MADKPPTLPGPPGSPAHARVKVKPVAVPPPVENRVAAIRRLMEEGEWGRRRWQELADKWGISEGRVRDHAAEASRQLRSLTREEAQAKVEALLARAETVVGYKDPAAALTRIALAYAKIYGLDRGPTKGAGGAGGGSSGARELEGSDEGTEEKDDFWG